MKPILLMFFAVMAYGRTCDSLVASFSNEWKPIATAPHDGTVVELMNTYGLAATYDIYKWTRNQRALVQMPPPAKPYEMDFQLDKPQWISQSRIGFSVDESECIFWRPYKATGKYVDPTGGRQYSVEYWCAAAKRKYDPKRDRCQ